MKTEPVAANTFTPITSKPFWLFNIITGTLVSLFGLANIGLWVFCIVYLFTGNNDPITLRIALVLITSVLAILSIGIIFYKKFYTQIHINEKGVWYYNKQVLKGQISWSNLKKNNEKHYHPYDISLHQGTGKYGRDYIYGFISKTDKTGIQRKEIRLMGGHPFYFFYQNKSELVIAFLQGIEKFRPDLSINPELFRHYFIDPNTYQVKQREKIFFYIMVTIVVATIFGLIYYFTSKNS